MSATRASLVDDFSAMRVSKSVVEIVVGLALFLEPLGRGIDVHTPLNYEIFDCEDIMCIKYIAGIGRNQDAVLISPA